MEGNEKRADASQFYGDACGTWWGNKKCFVLKGTNQGISVFAVCFFFFFTFPPGPQLQFWSAIADEEFTTLHICGCFL